MSDYEQFIDHDVDGDLAEMEDLTAQRTAVAQRNAPLDDTTDLRALAKHISEAVADGTAGVEPVALPWDTPPGWRIIRKRADGVMWRVPGGLHVIASAQRLDGAVWAHVSVSSKGGRLATWPEMVMVRDAVLGPHVEAYQVCPPADRYVNLTPVLHWWACIDKPEGVLPQFEGTVDGVRTI